MFVVTELSVNDFDAKKSACKSQALVRIELVVVIIFTVFKIQTLLIEDKIFIILFSPKLY